MKSVQTPCDGSLKPHPASIPASWPAAESRFETVRAVCAEGDHIKPMNLVRDVLGT